MRRRRDLWFAPDVAGDGDDKDDSNGFDDNFRGTVSSPPEQVVREG